MADLFEVSAGLSITDNNDIEKINVLPSVGPPGTTQEHDDAPRGSVALDELTGFMYTKVVQGTGTTSWKRQANEDDIAAVTSGQTWRDPVKVADFTTYTDITAAETALNANNGFDGVTLADGDRVLLGDLTTGADDIYIVSGVPGSGATLVPDTHTLQDGDHTYSQEGTLNGDNQYAFNGTAWVVSGSGNSTELSNLRAFVGKPTTGAVLPQYTSNNYVANNDDSTQAIGKLDAQVGTNAANITANTAAHASLQTEVDAIETAVGSSMNGDGTYAGFSNTNLLDTSTSLTDALTALDTVVGSNQDDAFIRAFIGKANAGAETPGYTSSTIVGATDDLETAIGKLDAYVDKERHELTVSANIGQNVVDSVLVDSVKAVEWHVHAQEVGSQDTRVVFVHGAHNGNTANDATSTDRSEFSRLRLGNVNGFRTRVTLTGTGASQVMQLEVRTNNSADLTITRKILA